ncbi:MAG: hypothetical protein E6G94_02360 [Alphaproteobacteria bacterium]|nr:MAG: hypothetical protein E6G94_02360 [Alphaproteobacteria bacterium]
MRTLALALLAGSAAFTASAAFAQTVPDPGWVGVPDMRIQQVGSAPPMRVQVQAAPRVQAMPGVSWREGSAQSVAVAAAPVAARGAVPPMQMQQMQMRQGMRPGMQGGMHGGMHGGMGMGSHHGGGNFQFRRIQRGGFLPQFWWGPQFVVRNWGMYGFPQPFNGGRWVRYYDDALLIDGRGRVYDSRTGMDWDRYGDRWGRNGDGVPVYVGDGGYDEDDYGDDRDDYADGGDGYGAGYGPPQGGCNDRCGPPPGWQQPPVPPPPGYRGYGYGAGYYSGPVVVTETITTTAPVMETRTYYETVRQPARRAYHRRVIHRAAPSCDCEAPAPMGDGERG